MKISSNMMAAYTINNLNIANNKTSAAMKRLSSGLKINSAKDNPASLAIGNKLDSQVRDLQQANRNVMDGISMVQTAEGALNEVSDMMTRLKELAVQSKNGTYDTTQKNNIQAEMDSLVAEINNIQKTTTFNGIKMLDTNEDIPIQIGYLSQQTMTIKADTINLSQVTTTLNGISINDADLLSKVEQATTHLNEVRGNLGAYQNRLEHTSNNLGVSVENTTSSYSRIMDADMAEEMTEYTSNNVLTQAGIAMLSQANQRPQQILQLLNS